MPFGMQLDMTQLAPFVALTAAAVGWIMLAFEKKANAELRRKLRRVETATVHATASNSMADLPLLLQTRATDASEPLETLEEMQEGDDSDAWQHKQLLQEIDRLRDELELTSHQRLLDAQDDALDELHRELIALRSSIQAECDDISPSSSIPSSQPASGMSTPGTQTPTRRQLSDPSPFIISSNTITASSTAPKFRLSTPSSSLSGHRLAFSASTSGTTTPITPQSPQLHNVGASALSSPPSEQIHIRAPLPPLPAPDMKPPQRLDAALLTALQHNSYPKPTDSEDSDNDEQWLLKTDVSECGSSDIASEKNTIVVRPLPRVPKLALPTANGKSGSLTSRKGPVTISSRGSITARGHITSTAVKPSSDSNGKFKFLSPSLKNVSPLSHNTFKSPRGDPPALMARRSTAPEAPTPRLMRPLKLDTTPGNGTASDPTPVSEDGACTARSFSRIPKPQ